MPYDGDAFYEQMVKHEGFKTKPYRCPSGKLTIGIGHNLDDNGLLPGIIRDIFWWDVQAVVTDLNRNLPWWKTLEDVRARVLMDMCFNMGIGTLRTFKKFLAALQAGNYELAAKEMEDSDWYNEVGTRGARLVQWMRTGEDDER